jgi:hypothetical protein
MTLEGAFAIQYIVTLEKAYKLYDEIICFIDNKHFLSNFALN